MTHIITLLSTALKDVMHADPNNRDIGYWRFVLNRLLENSLGGLNFGI